jgi:hypothetical protein
VAVVEFAILLPILVTFLVGIVEFGHVWYIQHALTNASREGARVGVVFGLTNTGAPRWGYQLENGKKVENTVKNYLGDTFVRRYSIQVQVAMPPSPATGLDLRVTVRATQNITLLLDALIQWFNPAFKGITLAAETTMRLE